MEPFATEEQYAARYGEPPAGAPVAECLADATALISAQLEARGIDWQDAGDDYADRLMRVCRQVAHRALQAYDEGEETPYGVSQATQAAGGYSVSYSFSNPYGDSFLTAAERRLLGIAGASVFQIGADVSPRIGRGGAGRCF
jgi:hypothetical protein